MDKKLQYTKRKFPSVKSAECKNELCPKICAKTQFFPHSKSAKCAKIVVSS